MPTAPDARVTEVVRIPLRTTGYRFAPGNRIRLTVLTSYWPVAVAVAVARASCASTPATCCTPSRLVLPVLPDDRPDARSRPRSGLEPVGHARGRLDRGGPAGVADRGGRHRRAP